MVTERDDKPTQKTYIKKVQVPYLKIHEYYELLKELGFCIDHLVEVKTRNIPYLKNKEKFLLVSGENIFYSYPFILYVIGLFEKIFKLNLSLLKKMTVELLAKYNLDILKLYPPKRRKYNRYIRNIANNKLENKYVILTNKHNRHSNIFSMPLALRRMSDGSDSIPIQPLIKKRQLAQIPPKFCCLIISNSNSIDRLHFVYRLSKYKKVDIYGPSILNNCQDQFQRKMDTRKEDVLGDYKFFICFENSVADDYITEKIPQAMLGGPIPIYKGAKNVGNYFNTDSFINYHDYDNSYTKMIDKIIELDQDDEKYRTFYNNKVGMTKKNIENYEKKQLEYKQFFQHIIDTYREDK